MLVVPRAVHTDSFVSLDRFDTDRMSNSSRSIVKSLTPNLVLQGLGNLPGTDGKCKNDFTGSVSAGSQCKAELALVKLGWLTRLGVMCYLSSGVSPGARPAGVVRARWKTR